MGSNIDEVAAPLSSFLISFTEYKVNEVPELVRDKGYRLPSPAMNGFKCDWKMYEMMQQCFASVPDMRPSFKDLSHRMEFYILGLQSPFDLNWGNEY